MSYKFQRLRERIRQAVTSGELSGKLPGERELARRFQVNAKTLSKALTDLASEGLLHRSIGRGTFVRSSQESSPEAQGAWLLLVDATSDAALIDALKSINPQAQTCNDLTAIRPSMLNQFTAVVDLASATPEALFRDLALRGISAVAVGQELRTYSVNGVMLDAMLGASLLARQLVLSGHRHFVAVEERGRIGIAESIRRTASRFCDDFSVDGCTASEVPFAIEYGVTACVCDSASAAVRTADALKQAGIAVPERMSLAAIGWTGEEYPCSGYYFDPAKQAAAIAEVLSGAHSGRPVTLWLAGQLVDRQTIAPMRASTPAQPIVDMPPQMFADMRMQLALRK
jgi:DNA-binding transcriptional regulator YhcF (GntR family)